MNSADQYFESINQVDDSVDEHAYRYSKSVVWDQKSGVCCFVSLRPIVPAKGPDLRFQRFIAYARDWGYGGAEQISLFPLVVDDELDALRHIYKRHIKVKNYIAAGFAISSAKLSVACWGDYGRLRGLAGLYCSIFPELHRYCITASGEPAEIPFYLKSNDIPVPLQGACE